MSFSREKQSSVLVALLHDLVRSGPFDSISEAADALKRRAAALKIRGWEPLDITAAIALVSRTRPVVRPLTLPRVAPPVHEAQPGLTRAEASAFYAGLLQRKRPTGGRLVEGADRREGHR